MKILVINSGSSSIKFQLFDLPEKTVLVKGLIDSIDLNTSTIHYQTLHGSRSYQARICNHKEALSRIVDLLLDQKNGILKDLKEVKVVAHRVVHGGSINKTSIIDQKVKSVIAKFSRMAPLHNPANLLGIEVSEKVFPEADQVAVFDTAFHTTIPRRAHQFAIPQALYQQEDIRVYGFHGTSHAYVYQKYKEKNPHNAGKVISLHLGNGCSVTAIHQGKSIDHSLGFSPLSGLVMGTRSGDLDPSVVIYLAEKLQLSLAEVNTLLNKKSGMLGLTGRSDLREIETRAEQGDHSCQMALELAAYRIRKYIGAYTAAMNGLDGIIFTGGIGENSSNYRKLACQCLDFIGIKLDEGKNESITAPYQNIQKGKGVIIAVIQTNEELAIASQAYRLLTEKKEV